jgi:hypothetical protein
MKHKLKFTGLFLLLALVFGINSCMEDTSTPPSYQYSIRLTDAPAPIYEEVNIDVQGVEVTGSNGVVEPEKVVPGIYNLLDYSNGQSELITTGALEDGKINQIRLILGQNNSVKINGQVYPLSTPSADQSGLKLQVQAQLKGGVQYVFLLDFDAYQSVVSLGNGSYKLKPVLRVYPQANGGTIRGTTNPAYPNAPVTLISSTQETYTSTVSDTGGFMIQGLPAGTYTLNITTSDQKTVTVSNINVTTGNVTDLGTLVPKAP